MSTGSNDVQHETRPIAPPELSPPDSPSPESKTRLSTLMNALPNEILSEIFIWCCPTFTDRFSSTPLSALALSHVCRRWRKIAFTTPRLWTYTSLGAPRHHCESTTELMLLWARNSKTLPLVIDIDFSRFAAYKTPDAILPTVLELSRLGAELKPARPPDDMPLTVAVEPSMHIPFPYVSEEYYYTNSEIRPDEIARGAFQLRVATRPCIILGMDGHKDFGPYLVRLDLRNEDGSICLTTEEALGILRTYPNLRQLTFRLGYQGDGEDDVHALPHLQTLCLSWCDEADPTPVLNSLVAPQLRDLELDGVIPHMDIIHGTIWDPLRQFLHRSTPPLRVLDLYKIRCDDVDLIGCLGRCTALERLWLEDCSISSRLISDFTDTTHPHPLIEPATSTLQNLKTLGLVRCEIFNAQGFFRSLVVTGLVWRVMALDGLFLSECNVHEGKLETWHFLRSRFEDGAYDTLE